MQIEEIEKFLDSKTTADSLCVKIDFKKRNTVYGLFVKDGDYNYLKSKNFWRIVSQQHAAEWKKSKSNNLVRIFSGSDFSKLSICKDSAEAKKN